MYEQCTVTEQLNEAPLAVLAHIHSENGRTGGDSLIGEDVGLLIGSLRVQIRAATNDDFHNRLFG